VPARLQSAGLTQPKRQFPLILRVDGAVAGRFEDPVVVQPERGALSISDDHV
jgi:hypothetical protein